MSFEKTQLDALICAILPDKNTTTQIPYIAINLTHERFLEWRAKTLDYFAQTGANSRGPGCFNEILESPGAAESDSGTTLYDSDPYDTATGMTARRTPDDLELAAVVPAARRELDLRMYDAFKRYVEVSVAGDASIAAVVRLHRPSSGALRCRSLLAWVERHSAAPAPPDPLRRCCAARRSSSSDSFSSCSLGGTVYARRSGGARTLAPLDSLAPAASNRRGAWGRGSSRVRDWGRAAARKVSGRMAGAASLMTRLLFAIVVVFVMVIMGVFTVKLQQILWTSVQALPTNQKGKVFVFSLALFVQLAPLVVAIFLGVVRGPLRSFVEGDGPSFVAAVAMMCLFVIPLLQLAIFYLYGKIFEAPKEALSSSASSSPFVF